MLRSWGKFLGNCWAYFTEMGLGLSRETDIVSVALWMVLGSSRKNSQICDQP
jgi:hypothetical protein